MRAQLLFYLPIYRTSCGCPYIDAYSQRMPCVMNKLQGLQKTPEWALQFVLDEQGGGLTKIQSTADRYENS